MLLTLPQNVEPLQRILHRKGFPEVEILGNEYLPPEKATGRYIHQGKAFNFPLRFRFYEYGVEDLEYLLYAGIVSPEMTVTVWSMDTYGMMSSRDYREVYQDMRNIVADFQVPKFDWKVRF